MNENDLILAGLKEIKKRRNILNLLIFVGLPISAVLHSISGPDPFWNYGGPIYFLILIYAEVRVNLLLCPRCRNKFHVKGILHFPWTRKCYHCGLKLNYLEEGGLTRRSS